MHFGGEHRVVGFRRIFSGKVPAALGAVILSRRMWTGALGAGVALWSPGGLLRWPYEEHEVQNRCHAQEPQLVERQQANNKGGPAPHPWIAPSRQCRPGCPESNEEGQGV